MTTDAATERDGTPMRLPRTQERRSVHLDGRALLTAGWLVVGLSACGVSSHAVRDPAHTDRSYTRVLVYAGFDPPKYPNLRKDVEGAIVANLKSARVDAAAAMDLAIRVPGPLQRSVNHDDLEGYKAKLLEEGFDCVLEVHVGDDALVYTFVGGTLRDMRELENFALVPISGGPNRAWVAEQVWGDGVELRSAGWSIEAIIVKGAERLAEDLIASGILSTQPVAAPRGR